VSSERLRKERNFMKDMLAKKSEKKVKGNNKGMTTVEVILIVVVIFTIYKGCK
jgi:hypothetical protein